MFAVIQGSIAADFAWCGVSAIYAVNRLWANQQQIDEYAVSFVET
jgi:uncharacterized membrane protein YadS